MAQIITSSNKVLDKIRGEAFEKCNILHSLAPLGVVSINIIGDFLLPAFSNVTRLQADFDTCFNCIVRDFVYPHIFAYRSSNTSRIAPTGIARESATLYSAAILGGDLQSNQAAQVLASTPVMAASCPRDKSKNNSFSAAKSSTSSYADFASLDCMVRDRRSRNATKRTVTGIFSAIAHRSKLLTLGVALPFSHLDHVAISSSVQDANSETVISKNNFLGLFDFLVKVVIKCRYRVLMIKSIITYIQTTKHPYQQVLVAKPYSRKDGLFFRRLYDNYIRPKGRLASPGFTMPISADVGGIVVEIYIKCEGKTALGLSFGQVIENLTENRITPTQAMSLIDELGTNVNSCTMMELLIGCTLLDFGADWVLLKPSKEKCEQAIESKPVVIIRHETKKATEGWVYLVKAKQLNQYKIGRSRTPDIRLRTLQMQSPVSLELISLIECVDMIETERYLHKKFAEYRIKGTEWFVLRTADVSWFQNQTTFEEVQ